MYLITFTVHDLKKRGIDDVNILCKLCNAVDYLERKYGNRRLRVVWDKPVTNTPVTSVIKTY